MPENDGQADNQDLPAEEEEESNQRGLNNINLASEKTIEGLISYMNFPTEKNQLSNKLKLMKQESTKPNANYQKKKRNLKNNTKFILVSFFLFYFSLSNIIRGPRNIEELNR